MKQIFLPKQLCIVGISRWLSACAIESQVLSSYSVETISNNVDTVQFSPADVRAARQALRLPLDKKIVLAGSQTIGSFYKGFDLFLDAINALRRDDVHVVLIGKAIPKDVADLKVGYSCMGFLSDTISLRLAYSAADVFVAPSRMEAFGKTLAEAMACGTPVVCFDATGPKDIVAHRITGYKAEPFDASDLCEGIGWVLSRDASDHVKLRQQARDRAVRLFDSRVIAGQYIALYERLLAERKWQGGGDGSLHQ